MKRSASSRRGLPFAPAMPEGVDDGMGSIVRGSRGMTPRYVTPVYAVRITADSEIR